MIVINMDYVSRLLLCPSPLSLALTIDVGVVVLILHPGINDGFSSKSDFVIERFCD